MNNPTTPQTQRTMMGVVLGLFAVLLLLAVWLVITSSRSEVGFGPLVLVPVLQLLLVLIAVVMGVEQWRVANRHARLDGGHWCLCVDCDRTCRPVGPPGRRRSGFSPRHRRLGGYLAFVTIPVMLGAFIPIIQLLWALSGPVASWVVIAIAIALALMLLAIGVNNLRKAAKGTGLPPNHGCLCRWCGAPGWPA